MSPARYFAVADFGFEAFFLVVFFLGAGFFAGGFGLGAVILVAEELETVIGAGPTPMRGMLPGIGVVTSTPNAYELQRLVRCNCFHRKFHCWKIADPAELGLD